MLRERARYPIKCARCNIIVERANRQPFATCYNCKKKRMMERYYDSPKRLDILESHGLKQCFQCQKAFKRPTRKDSPGIFCSKLCSNRWRTKNFPPHKSAHPPIKNCLLCSISFRLKRKEQIFCSNSCSIKWRLLYHEPQKRGILIGMVKKGQTGLSHPRHKEYEKNHSQKS